MATVWAQLLTERKYFQTFNKWVSSASPEGELTISYRLVANVMDGMLHMLTKKYLPHHSVCF